MTSIETIGTQDQAGWARFHAALEQFAATADPAQGIVEGDVRQVLRRAEWDGLPAVTEAVSPDGRLVLTESGCNLAVRPVDTPDSRQLTQCGTEDEPWRVNAQVYSLLPAGPVWSPDGSRVVSVRADLRDVPQRVFVNWQDGARTSRSLRLPAESSPHYGLGRLAVIDISGGDITWADLPANVHWTPLRWLDGGRAVVALGIDLAGELWLSRVDSRSGAAVTLVRERVPSVFPYLATVVSAAATTLPDTDDALWTSDRDGDLRLYRVTPTDARPLTPPGVQIAGVIGVTDHGVVRVVARSNPAAPYARQVCRAHQNGTFEVVEPLPETQFADGSGQPFVVTAADGITDLHGVLFTPPGFTPSRRYPVIDCVYGGPQTIAHRCDDHNGHHLWGCSVSVAAALAALGFVTVVVDSRGTPGRGRAFQWPETVDRADVVVADHRAALRALAAKRPWLDLTRCGIIGTSFGAYHAVRSGLLEPDLFRAVAAHAGPYHPADALPGWFPGVLGASYDNNPEAYDAVDLVRHASSFDPELLLIHGTDDTNVTMDHTLRLSDALNRAGRHHELLLLAGQRHHLDRGADVFALERAGRFFRQHLG